MVELELIQLLALEEREGIVLELLVTERPAVVGMVEVARVGEREEAPTVVK